MKVRAKITRNLEPFREAGFETQKLDQERPGQRGDPFGPFHVSAKYEDLGQNQKELGAFFGSPIEPQKLGEKDLGKGGCSS